MCGQRASGGNRPSFYRTLPVVRHAEPDLCARGIAVDSAGDAYVTGRIRECEKFINAEIRAQKDERQRSLLAKYPEGVTEETLPADGVVIIKRVLVKDNTAWVYEKKIFNWGGIACFRDGGSVADYEGIIPSV